MENRGRGFFLMHVFVGKLFTAVCASGPWPVVVLLLCALALILLTFGIIQRGRSRAVLKIARLVTLDVGDEIEERIPRSALVRRIRRVRRVKSRR